MNNNRTLGYVRVCRENNQRTLRWFACYSSFSKHSLYFSGFCSWVLGLLVMQCYRAMFNSLTLYGQIKTAEQRTIIQQYTDWYFIHWPLMGGLLHMVQPTVPTASTASVPTLYYSMWHYNCLCTLMKGLTECRALPHMQLLMTQKLLCKMFRFSVCWLLIFCSSSNSQIRLHARQWRQLFQPTTRRSSSLKHDQLLTAASRHVSAL